MKERILSGMLCLFLSAYAVSVSAQQWTTNGTNIHNANTGNVGVGTSSPAAKFQVLGETRLGASGNYVKVNSSGSLSFVGSGNLVIGDNKYAFKHSGGGNRSLYINKASNRFEFRDSLGNDLMHVDYLNGNSFISGKIGIGFSTPQYAVHASGDGGFTGNVIVDIGNINNGGITNSLRFGTLGTGSTASISSKKTAGGNLNGLDFNTGLSTRLSITSSGNVGIGTSAPGTKLEVAGQVKITGGTPGAGKVLTSDANGLATWQTPSTGTVTGTGSATRLAFWNGTSSLTSSGNLFWDNTNSNLGIGTASPMAKLDVAGNIALNNNELRLGPGSNGNYGLKYLAAGIDGPYLFGFNGGALGAVGMPHSLSWDYLGNAAVRENFNVGHNLVVDTNDANTGTLDYILRFGHPLSGEAIGSKRNSGGNQFGLDFWTAQSIRMSITAAGKMGIGTSAPEALLEVKHASSGTSPHITLDESTADFSRLNFKNNTGSSYWSVGGLNHSTQADERFTFYNSKAADNLFVLTGDGNVGIENYNPSAKLAFGNDTGDKISLYSADSNHYGIGLQANLFQLYTESSSNDIAFGYGNSNSFGENLRIKGNGRVGIGTSSPGSKLELFGPDVSLRLSTSLTQTQGFVGSEAVSGSNGSLLLGIYNPTGSLLNEVAPNTSKSCLRIGGTGIIGSVEDTFGINKGYQYRNLLDDGSGSLWVDYTGQFNGNMANNSKMMRFGTSSANCGIGLSNNGYLKFWNGSNSQTNERLIIKSTGSVIVGDDESSTAKLFVDGYETTAAGKGACLSIGNDASSIGPGAGANWHLRVGGPGTDTPDGGFSIGDDVGIVMTFNGSDVSVCGTLKSKEVRVETGWCDYVFDKGYNLKPIEEVEKFINENKHLPGIPPASKVENEGLNVGEMNKAMMEKIEELTLYVIQLSKENKKIAQDNEQLKKQMSKFLK